jgi:hypothetical protein
MAKKVKKTGDKPAPKSEPGMSASEFQALVTSRAQEAADHITQVVSHDREQATRYYNGELPDVDGEDMDDDRSTVVMTEVRDTVLGMMPDLLRVFFGSDGVCAYQPVASEDPDAVRSPRKRKRATLRTSCSTSF